MKPGERVVDVENLEVPAEDSAALERALKAYRESKSIRRRKPARAPSSVRESSTPIEAGSPRVVGFTIEDSAPPMENPETLPVDMEGLEEETTSGDLGDQGI
jgi:hypothetical protein